MLQVTQNMDHRQRSIFLSIMSVLLLHRYDCVQVSSQKLHRQDTRGLLHLIIRKTKSLESVALNLILTELALNRRYPFSFEMGVYVC